MPNYSLRLRPIYGQDEETGGERISRGIGSAIQQYMTREEAARQERNEVAARGGTPVPSADPGIMGRVRGIGGALRRVLHGTPPINPNAPVTETGLQTGTDMARDGFGESNVTPPLFGAPAGDIDMKGRVRGTNRFPTVAQAGGTPTMATPPAAPGRAAPGRPSFSSEIQPYIYEGQGGRKYQMDPMYQQRVAMQGHEMQANATEQRTIAGEQRQQAASRTKQQEQIDALVQGGMPPGEARARVLNNVVRYDEDFGQYRRPVSASQQLTFEQRQTLQKQRDDAAYTRAQLSANGRENTEEFRRASLALQAADLALKAANDRAAGFERTAGAAEREVPQNPIDRQIATSTPAGASRVATAESTAAANRDSAGRIRGEAGAAATGTAGSVQRSVRPDVSDTGGRGAAPRKSVGDRDAELKAQGKKADERRRILKAEGYNVR